MDYEAISAIAVGAGAIFAWITRGQVRQDRQATEQLMATRELIEVLRVDSSGSSGSSGNEASNTITIGSGVRERTSSTMSATQADRILRTLHEGFDDLSSKLTRLSKAQGEARHAIIDSVHELGVTLMKKIQQSLGMNQDNSEVVQTIAKRLSGSNEDTPTNSIR